MNQFLTEEDIWDRVEEIAEDSSCKKRKVGCVIVDVDTLEELSAGYNYSPINGGCEDGNGDTYYHVIHAEVAALSLLQKLSDRSAVAFVNHQPCSECEEKLFKAGLKDILVRPTAERWPKPKTQVKFEDDPVDAGDIGKDMPEAEDPINPKHYSDIKEFQFAAKSHDAYQGFLHLNAKKYIDRMWHKEKPKQDFEKAEWYLAKLKETL